MGMVRRDRKLIAPGACLMRVPLCSHFRAQTKSHRCESARAAHAGRPGHGLARSGRQRARTGASGSVVLARLSTFSVFFFAFFLGFGPAWWPPPSFVWCFSHGGLRRAPSAACCCLKKKAKPRRFAQAAGDKTAKTEQKHKNSCPVHLGLAVMYRIARPRHRK